MMLMIESTTHRRDYNRTVSKCNTNNDDCSDEDKDNDIDGHNNTVTMNRKGFFKVSTSSLKEVDNARTVKHSDLSINKKITNS